MKINKIKAIILMFLMAISIVSESFSHSSYVYATEWEAIDNSYIEQATDKVEEVYISMVEMVKNNYQYYQVEIGDVKKISLGEPYYIYDVVDSEQSEILYYPIVQDDKIVLIISVFFNGTNWNYGISEDISSALNFINAGKESYVVYETYDALVVETNTKNTIVAEFESEKEDICQIDREKSKEFEKLSFEEKKEIIDKNETNIRVEKEVYDEVMVDTGYTPQYTRTVTDYSRTCSLTASGYTVSQEYYGLCWAASVATIYRYRTGNTTLTAMQVADLMEIEYSRGAFPEEACQALAKYGIYYTYKNSVLSWEKIMQNIDSKYPIYMSSKIIAGGHATTIMGYSDYRGNRFMTMWNPETNQYQGVTYTGEGTQYTYNDTTYTWRFSLCYK